MPHSAAGWRMLPPVSVPSDTGASHAATLAALPPLLPPGMRVVSHGLVVCWYALFSVLLPIANSSMFVLPRITASSAFSRSTTCASYGGMKFSSTLLLQVVRIPLVQSTSFTATGTPASLPSIAPLFRLASMASACFRTSASFTSMNAFTFGSRCRMLARKASAIWAAVVPPDACRASNSVAVFSINCICGYGVWGVGYRRNGEAERREGSGQTGREFPTPHTPYPT